MAQEIRFGPKKLAGLGQGLGGDETKKDTPAVFCLDGWFPGPPQLGDLFASPLLVGRVPLK